MHALRNLPGTNSAQGARNAAHQRTVGMSNLLLPSGVGLPIRWKGPCSDRNLPSFPASVLLCRGGLD